MKVVFETAEVGMRDARRRLLMKRALEVVGWLLAVALFAFAGRAVLAGPDAAGERRPAAQAISAGAGERELERRSREAAASFARRFGETRDLAPLVEEFFVEDFAERLCRGRDEGDGDDDEDFPMEHVGDEACARASPAELRRYYVAAFNFASLFIEYATPAAAEPGPSGGKGATPEEFYPAEVLDLLRGDTVIPALVDWDEAGDGEEPRRRTSVSTVAELADVTLNLERASASLRGRLPARAAPEAGGGPHVYCPHALTHGEAYYDFPAGTRSVEVDVQALLLLQFRFLLVGAGQELKVLTVAPVFDGDGGC
jgi:hypothetical protein